MPSRIVINGTINVLRSDKSTTGLVRAIIRRLGVAEAKELVDRITRITKQETTR